MSERKGSAKVGGRRCLARRSGLTILEFVACGVAVAGGAWLGALYLGVNMQHVAFAALSQTRLLDKVPEEYRPADPNAKAMTHEQLATALHEELGSLRTQISSLNGVPTQTADKATEKESGPSTGLAPTKEKTLAYWQKLREIASTNSQLQREAESAFTVDNAAKVFAVKGRVCRFSAKAVEAAGVSEALSAVCPGAPCSDEICVRNNPSSSCSELASCSCVIVFASGSAGRYASGTLSRSLVCDSAANATCCMFTPK